MATQEPLTSGNRTAALQELSGAAPRVSLVVDQPVAAGQALLLLPFASPAGEAALGRHIGTLLQQRLQRLPGLAVGHGLLIAVGVDTRLYLPLPHPMSAAQALTCAAEWRAGTVLYGAITLEPDLEWSVALVDAASERLLLEEVVTGTPQDLPKAVAMVARWVALAMGYGAYDHLLGRIDQPDTSSLEALLAFCEAVEAHTQYGVDTAGGAAMRAALLRALSHDPTFRAPAIALMRELARTGEDDQLLPLLAPILPAGPERIPVLVGLAEQALTLGYLQQSEALAAAILALHADCTEGLILASRLAYQSRRFAQARLFANALLDLDSESVQAHELLGEALAAEGRFVGAAQEWEYLLERDPAHHRAQQRLGAYLFVVGDHARAYQLLRQAATRAAVSLDTLILVGTLAYRRGAYHEAAAALRRAIQRDPSVVRAHTLLANCYRRLGSDHLALRHAAYAATLAPAQWVAALALGYDALHAGRAVDAVVSFAYVVHVRPELADGLYGLGQALLAGGMVFDGILALERAQEVDRRNPRILCALALAQQQAGNALAAAQTLAAAETIAPRSKLVGRARRALKQAAYE